MKTNLLRFVLLTSLLPSLALAQATRTWVSGVGDDANPCSRTAPGKTFAGAISKTAAKGVINVLDPGGFGAVTITKSITIDGGGIEGNITAGSVNGIIVSAGTNDIVVLRNLSIEGTGTGLSGIRILSAGEVHIENCRVNGFTDSGIKFVSSVSNAKLFVRGTTIHKCTLNGIDLSPAAIATVLIEKSNVSGCGDGIKIAAKIEANITDTTASGNAGNGFLVFAGGKMVLVRGTATDNLYGVQSAGNAIISESTVSYNQANGFIIAGAGKIKSFGNNTVTGNTPNGTPSSLLTAW